MQKPSIGRIVHVHLLAPAGANQGKLVTRPAVVVEAWPSPKNMVNARVLFDGANDLGSDFYRDPLATAQAEWVTSIEQLGEGEEPRALTWSWPPRV